MIRYKIGTITVRIFNAILISIIVALVIFLLNGYMELGVVSSKVNEFKKRGEFVKIMNIQNQEVKIYRVSPKYEYEKNDLRKVFDHNSSDDFYVGSNSDIILSTRNPLLSYSGAIVRDIAGFFANTFYIGHATINVTNEGDQVIESVGNDDDFYGVRVRENTWVKNELRISSEALTIVGLRIKNIDDDARNRITEYLMETVGMKYNMFFLLPLKNQYYCTDLITRTLKKEGINLNYDHFFALGSDMIVSSELYIIFICERTNDGQFEIYYMGVD